MPVPDKHVWVQREHPYHVETILRWGLQEGFCNFIVWGGDGTLHRAVQSFSDLDLWEKATLGVVPVGTCNDLARYLGLPAGGISKALQVIKKQEVMKIDIGVASWQNPESGEKHSQIFINNAGFGRSLTAIRKNCGAVRNVLDFQAHPLRVEAGGLAHEGEFLMGVICNGPFFSGGLRFSSDISCVDGRLDAFFVQTSNKIGLLARLALARLGRSLMSSEVTHLSGKNIRVDSEDGLFLQADGEILTAEETRRFEFTIIPNKLRFLVP